MKKALQIGNGLALGSTIYINYLSNTGLINGTTIGEMSNGYRSVFTPAGYTFAIWGLIYLLLILFTIYQGRSLFVHVKDDSFVEKIGIWFILSCVFNSFWVFAWIYEYTGLSCVLIFLLLISLIKIVINLGMEHNDGRFPLMAFVWWPFAIYFGWVTVASIANVSSYLIKLKWDGFGLPDNTWTIIMICIAVIINLYVMWKRNMRAFTLVGAWALIGIGVANSAVNEIITTTTFIAAAILITTNGIHGFKNLSANPFAKYWEWQAEKKS